MRIHFIDFINFQIYCQDHDLIYTKIKCSRGIFMNILKTSRVAIICKVKKTLFNAANNKDNKICNFCFNTEELMRKRKYYEDRLLGSQRNCGRISRVKCLSFLSLHQCNANFAIYQTNNNWSLGQPN